MFGHASSSCSCDAADRERERKGAAQGHYAATPHLWGAPPPRRRRFFQRLLIVLNWPVWQTPLPRYKLRQRRIGVNPLRREGCCRLWQRYVLPSLQPAKPILTIWPKSMTLSLKCILQRCLRVTMFSCKCQNCCFYSRPLKCRPMQSAALGSRPSSPPFLPPLRYSLNNIDERRHT